jgi:PAS domain S-box-containing protein
MTCPAAVRGPRAPDCASSVVLRNAAVAALALATVILAAWAVHWTVDRARTSNRWLAHTHEVLAAAETVLSTVIDADASVRSYLLSGGADDLQAFGRADREISAYLDTLAALTADNPDQQTRVGQLRREVADAFTALHALADTKRAAPGAPASSSETELGRIDRVRRSLQAIRLEEEQLFRQRSQDDQAAVGRLEWMSILILLAATGVLAYVLVLLSRDVSRQQQGADSLRRQNVDLTAQVDARVAELSDSNARLRSIINSAVDGIIVIDAKGRIEAFNPGAERLFGYPEAEVIGRNVSTLMPSPYHEEHDGYLERYLTTGAAKIIGVGREVTGRRRDGTEFPLHLSVGEMAVTDERKFTGMLHDLSERVRLEARLRGSEARWRAVIDSAVDGIIVIDARGRIEAFNPAAERLFGYAEADVVGKNVNMLMPSPYHGEHDTYLARYLTTGTQKIIGLGREVSGLRRDGTTFPLHLSVGEITVGGERRFTGILHDLSARVRIEEQLREQESMARIGEMAAVIAHEVKNPLAGVRGAISVIGSRLPPRSKDAGIVKEIVARIDALNDLMKDLLLFARPPHPRPSPIDMARLVALTAENLRQDPALQGVQVDVSGVAPPVHVDTEMLKIVFQNLLINGAHAMRGKGQICVSVTAADAMCSVSVSDTGPGIPPEIREKIFTPFFTTKSRGSGLGLATAKRLIEAHHGRITIECPPAGGTTVTVQLPAPPS